ncbi:MAG TPA: nucleotidyltransferase family protein, partial [Gemmatimonadaceae bacterium]
MEMSLSMLSPEAELLLLTAGSTAVTGPGGPGHSPTSTSARARRIGELLRGELDWEKLGWLAERERAAPVLWSQLQSMDGLPGDLPPQAAHLQRLAMVSEFRMMHLEQRLAESLAALSHAGIEVMLLKGAALALTVYGSFVRRPMVDVDMLVHEEEAKRARDVLVEAGWVSSEVEEFEGFYSGHHHLPALVDGRGLEVQLEVHTGLFFEGNPFNFPVADLWRRAVPVTVRGRRAYVPSTTDQLLHLCLHFAWSHMMNTGAWRTFRDLRALLDAGDVRWDDFVALARQSRGASCCYWTLRLARDLVGVEVPEAVLEQLRPPLSRSTLERVERHFVYHLLPTEALCPSVFMARTMWRLGVRPRWSGHGRVRPWDRNEELLIGGLRPDSLTRRALDQLRNVKGWTRYVRSVLLAG